MGSETEWNVIVSGLGNFYECFVEMEKEWNGKWNGNGVE